MMSCEPSDPTPPISDYDLVLKGGKYQLNFDDPKIVHNHEYQVIFTIEDCDPAFVGSKLGGKICYKMDLNSDDEKVLSGWAIAVPPTVSKEVKTYTWTFKAGASNVPQLPLTAESSIFHLPPRMGMLITVQMIISKSRADLRSNQ